MKSVIYLKEEVPNTARIFGSGLSYYPVMVEDGDGNETPALFTRAQLKEARMRAARNPEDLPAEETFWKGLFG